MQPVSAMPSLTGYPAAIFPSRLEWLCQPEQIEQTLRLVYYLNFWKKAQQHLLYVDRLGLYTVQLFVLLHALKTGIVRAVAYLDGTQRFPGELSLDCAAGNAARGVLAHLNALTSAEIWPPFRPEGDVLYQTYIRPLYRRITGQNYRHAAEAVGVVELARLRGYIQERLQRLVRQAQETRQPLSTRRLAALCIAPADLLPLRGNRYHFLETCANWNELDLGDQRKLDPEGYSEIAVVYNRAQTAFTFHLPLRQVEMFLDSDLLRELHRHPGASQELGHYEGQPIDDKESAAHPAREILQDLGVDIGLLCPRDLLDRTTFLASLVNRDLLNPGSSATAEPGDWTDDPWDSLNLPPHLL